MAPLELLRTLVPPDLSPRTPTLEIPASAPFGPIRHRRFGWTAALGADQLIGLAGTFTTNGPPSDADATYVDHAFKIGYRWDPTKGDYVRFGSAHVVRDGG